MSSDRTQPSISFVVIAHNAPQSIEGTFHSILAQEGLDVQQLTVLDDGSSDPT